MPTTDFRRHAFDKSKIEKCGRDLGQKEYPDLFQIENTARILLHSVLTAQLGENWWELAVAAATRLDVERRRERQQLHPWSPALANHAVYLLFWGELIEIIRVNKRFFQPIIPDIDDWIVELELLIIARNVIAHMNWLGSAARQKLQALTARTISLVDTVRNRRITLHIP